MLRKSTMTLVLVALASVVPASASAYSEPTGLEGSKYAAVCPPRPADAAGGASQVETLLVTIAQEDADACYRREQLAEEQHTDLQGLETAVGKLEAKLGGTLTTIIEGEPRVQVSNQASLSTVEFAEPAKQVIRRGGLNAAVYVAGALFALLILALIYRAFGTKGGGGSNA